MAPSTQYVIEHQRHVYTGPHAGDPGFTAWVPVDKLDAVYHRDALDAYLERQGEGARHGRYRVLKDTGFGLDVLEYVVAKRNVFDVERVKSAAVGEDVVVGLTEAA